MFDNGHMLAIAALLNKQAKMCEMTKGTKLHKHSLLHFKAKQERMLGTLYGVLEGLGC